MINTSQAGHSAGLQFLIIRLGNPKTNGDPMLKDPIDHTNASLSALTPEALDQMKENAQAAASFLKARNWLLSVPPFISEIGGRRNVRPAMCLSYAEYED